MSKYHNLISFIPYLEDPNAEWLDRDEAFHPFYASYSRLGYELIDAIADLMDGPKNTYMVLEKYNLEYYEIDFDTFDYNSCPEDLAFAILGVMLRKERFCAGEVFGMIKRGHVLRLLKVLEKYDVESKYEYCILFGGAIIVRAKSLLYNEQARKLGANYPQWTMLGYDDESKGIFGRTDLKVTEEEALKHALTLGVTKEDFYEEVIGRATNYEIVAISGEREPKLDLFGVTVFARANNQYYYFNFYGNLVEGRPTGKRGDIPLGNWFIGIRDFTEKDYDDYPEFVKGIERYFKER